MTEQYTNSAKTVIREARKAAQSFGHTYIGSEHLLLGLLREKEGTASRLLREYQVEEEKVAGLIDTLITPVRRAAWQAEGVYEEPETAGDGEGRTSFTDRLGELLRREMLMDLTI